MKKLSLIAALTLSTMLSACGGGGGHGGHIPTTTLPDTPDNPSTNTCSANPETCMTTTKISTEAVNEYLSEQVEHAENETAAASYSLKSRARAKAASSNDTMENRVKTAYAQMKALLIDSVSEKEDEVTVNRAENEVELKKSLLLAGYSVSDLNTIEENGNLADWADTNALTIKRKAEQTYNMYFDKKGNLKEVGMENAKLTMVNIGEKQDSYVNFLVDKSGKITGLHFDVSSDSADSRGVDFGKTEENGKFKRNGLILAYSLKIGDNDLYLESFEKLNLGQLKKRLRAKLAEEGYDNTSDWEEAINNLNANDLKTGGNKSKGFNIGGLSKGNRDAFITYTSKGSDIDGKGTNLLYSDFGTVHVNSWEGEEDKIDETFVFAGGYEAKRISQEQLLDKEMEFEGKAVAALIYQYPNTNNECEGERCEKSTNYDGTAKLVFAKGNETLTANFDKWYNVTVTSSGDNYDINFSDKDKKIEDIYKFTDDTVKNGITGFVGTAENDSHYGAVDIGYYGDKGNPSEATGYVAYGEVIEPGTDGNSGNELHSQIGFGTQRTK